MIIGDALVAELEAQALNPQTLTALNTTLLTYVKKFLAWQAYQFYLPKANLKDTRAGLRVMQEDNSQAATDKQMAELIRDAKMWCQTQKEKLVQYLDDNYESYPLYEYECNSQNRTGTGFHITAVGGRHKPGCGCHSCNGHT